MGNSVFNGSASALRGAVFDLDGTLVTQDLDFAAIRREIGLPVGQPLLEALDRMSDTELEAASAILDRHEHAAAASAVLNPGVGEFLVWLARLGVK